MLGMLRLVAKTIEPAKGLEHRERASGSDALSQLSSRAVAGERAAQRTLLCALGPSMLRTIRGILGRYHPDLEDTFQESCIALLSALPRFRRDCTTTHFACRVAARTALNVRRRRLVAAPGEVDTELDHLASGEAPSELVLRAEQRELLRRLLDELPPARAEVLVLHVILGYTVEETAVVTEVPVNTVRSRLRRALEALRARVDGDHAMLELAGGNDEVPA